jgi:hypothetical protein
VAGDALKHEGDDGHGRSPQLRFPEAHSSRLVGVEAEGDARSCFVRALVAEMPAAEVFLIFISLPSMFDEQASVRQFQGAYLRPPSRFAMATVLVAIL